MVRLRVNAPFPLLAKELAESAVRKRTYAARVAYAVGLFGVFAVFFLTKIVRLQLYPHRLFGYGAHVFEFLVSMQFVGIIVFLPAVMSGVIVSEKERDSLPLLLVTDLRPREILLQKYVGGLLSMLTVLLISLPLFAIAYALGGVTQGHLAAGSYLLLLSCLQIGALSLLCSTFCASVVSAFVGSYLLTSILYLGLPLLYAMGHLIPFLRSFRRIDEDVLFALFPMFIFYDTRSKAFSTVVLRSVPILVSTVVFLCMARWYLLKRAFLRSGNTMLQVWGWVDKFVNWGVVLFRESETLPDDEPVAWREISRKGLGKPRYLVRVFLLIEIPVLFFAGSALVSYPSRSRQVEALSMLVFVVWLLAALTVALQSANAIPAERVRRTLDALLASPLTGAEILRQKLRGVRRSALVFSGPFLTLFLLQAWWERPGPVRNPHYLTTLHTAMQSEPGLYALSYLLLSALTVVVFLPVFTWLSLWIGLRSRTRTRAMLCAVAAVVIINAIPILAAAAAQGAGQPVTQILDWGMLLTLSPAGTVCCLEMRQSNPLSSPEGTIACLLIYAVALIWIRRQCLDNADRYLGRTPTPQARPRRRWFHPLGRSVSAEGTVDLDKLSQSTPSGDELEPRQA